MRPLAVPQARGMLCLCLCLCVLLQLLGVPAPLLSAGSSFQLDESSVQEGWSIYTVQVQLPTFSNFVRAGDTHLFISVPVLTRALFRPPLS